MKKVLHNMIAAILVIATVFSLAIPTFAAGGEEYISELRLVYAEDYDEAKDILADSEFEDYKLLNENLNADSDKIGAWLAYKTTTNIEEAITDLAVMQMNGGYSEGNYQEMIKQSYDEYVAMGEIYLQAIEYFIEAYDADDYLAEVALRQLNFYNIVSVDVPEDEIPTFEGERLGDVFYEGIDEYELATIFFQGNVHVLNNVRSLLAMGVSYNEDGKAYLDKVGDAVEEMEDDPTEFGDEDLDMLASLIAPSIGVFADMFEELETVEDELNFEDEEFTDLEILYLEYYSIAQRMRKVEYLGGKTLYQFCLDYVLDEDDYSELYPLAYALNEGQQAMTKVFHYYDVVRYSATSYSEEAMEETLAPMEEKYGKTPFNVYEGVDRSIYYGTFALTSAAERADAYTEETTLADAFFGKEAGQSLAINVCMFTTGATLFITAYGVMDIATEAAKEAAQKAAAKAAENATNYVANMANTQGLFSVSSLSSMTGTLQFNMSYESLVNHIILRYYDGVTYDGINTITTSTPFSEKLAFLDKNFTDGFAYSQSLTGQTNVNADLAAFKQMSSSVSEGQKAATLKSNQAQAQIATATASTGAKIFAGILYIAGGAMMLYSAYNLIMTVVNYYHPDYDDVPLSMVDLINTVDGDRYIKYDVVLEAETNDKGEYSAADLNAFAAQRWNALYYTKSYEAGKPLLADAFVLSNNNNQPKQDHTPVHRFGEKICYDLNKYNFEGDTSIYLSVKQSKNDKFAAAGVPEVVGSMFSTGYLLLAGGIGAALGVGGTFATQSIIKKKRAKG
jgi:hypothetical protein